MLARRTMVMISDDDCATVCLQKAVTMLHNGSQLIKFMRAKPKSEPNRYAFRVDDLFLCWEGKGSKHERRRIIKARKGIATRPMCEKCFTITLVEYGDMSLAADSKKLADMWVNGLQYLLWSRSRERAGIKVCPNCMCPLSLVVTCHGPYVRCQ